MFSFWSIALLTCSSCKEESIAQYNFARQIIRNKTIIREGKGKVINRAEKTNFLLLSSSQGFTL